MLLKNCIEIKNGKDYSHLAEGDIPVYGTGGIFKYVDKYLYDDSALLLPRKGSLNNVMYVENQKFWTVDTMFYAICKNDNVNLKYLYYYLTLLNIGRFDVGSTVPSMTTALYYQIDVPFPDRKTQDKIAEILSGIDEQINRNNEIVKRLQVLGNTIYSDAFKDCSATCSLLDFPHIQLMKQGIDEFAGEKHYVATADVTNNNLNFDAQKITFDNREGRANMQPVKNSVWFAQMKNSIKHIFISNNDDCLVDNYIFSTGFYGFECNEIAYEFMIGTLSLPYFEQIKDKMANGAIMASINSDSLNLIKIPMPTEEQLSAYHEKTKYIYMQISAIKTENHKLSKLKEKLLPLLINGQLSA